MVYLFKIEKHILGSHSTKDLEQNKVAYNNAKHLIDALEGVINGVYPRAQNISHTGKAIVGDAWEDRYHGRAYELPNGAAFIDFTLHSSGRISWYDGRVSLVGDDGLQGEDSTLAVKIRDCFESHGVDVVEESVHPLDEVEVNER